MGITPVAVLDEVAERLHVTVDEIRSPTRVRHVAYARHVAMFLLRRLCKLTWAAIATAVNRADHTTAIHGVRRIEQLLESHDRRTAGIVADLTFKLSHVPAGAS